MRFLNLTNDLGELNCSGNLVVTPTTLPAPAGTPTACEPVWITYTVQGHFQELRGVATVVPSDDDRSCVYVQNLDDGDLNFYLGSRWSDLELNRASIFEAVTVS